MRNQFSQQRRNRTKYTYDATTTGSVFSALHRPQTTVYPNGRTIYSNYDTSGSAYDRLSNVRTIWDTSPSGTSLKTYDDNGAGSQLALATVSQPSLKLDKFQGTSGTYAGRDRFGRTTDQFWDGFGGTSDADRIGYGYDYASNRTYRDIDAAIYATNDKDQAYTHDGLDRLATLKRGTLSSGTIGGTPAAEETWSLDTLGNWANYVVKAAGTTTLNQGRAANENTSITASVGANWIATAYDAAGNLTNMPRPNSLTTRYVAVYDAWNRLVSLANAGSPVALYEYDGRGYRTVVKSYTCGTLSETRHAYFTDDWRVVEERVGTATTADRQFVGGARYIDELILRDRAETLLNERPRKRLDYQSPAKVFAKQNRCN